MSTHNIQRVHNIQLYDKIESFPYLFLFLFYLFIYLSYRKNFVRTHKRIRISHGKRAIIKYTIFFGSVFSVTISCNVLVKKKKKKKKKKLTYIHCINMSWQN